MIVEDCIKYFYSMYIIISIPLWISNSRSWACLVPVTHSARWGMDFFQIFHGTVHLSPGERMMGFCTGLLRSEFHDALNWNPDWRAPIIRQFMKFCGFWGLTSTKLGASPCFHRVATPVFTAVLPNLKYESDLGDVQQQKRTSDPNVSDECR